MHNQYSAARSGRMENNMRGPKEANIEYIDSLMVTLCTYFGKLKENKPHKTCVSRAMGK